MNLKNYFFITILYLLVLLNLSSCSHLMTNQDKKVDLYWSELVNESTQQKKSIIKILEKSNPSLYNQIIKDAEDPALLSFWGKSINFDSGVKKKILNDELITDLQA